MNRLLTAAIAVSALAAAAPVMAQSHYDDRATQLDQRIDDGAHDGRLSWSDARALRAQLHSAQRLQDQYDRDGMTSWQRRDLDRRFDRLSNNISNMESDSFE
jgi:hypothetical protein